MVLFVSNCQQMVLFVSNQDRTDIRTLSAVDQVWDKIIFDHEPDHPKMTRWRLMGFAELWSERKHGRSAEQCPVSAYAGSSNNLKDLKVSPKLRHRLGSIWPPYFEGT